MRKEAPAPEQKINRLGVIAALQLLWVSAEPNTIERVKPYLDPALYPWQCPARSPSDNGAVISGACGGTSPMSVALSRGARRQILCLWIATFSPFRPRAKGHEGHLDHGQPQYRLTGQVESRFG